jgi:hypothetical protein
MPEHALAAVGAVGQDVEAQLFVCIAEPMQQFHGELGAGAVDASGLLGGVLVQIETKQDREAEDALGCEGQAHHDGEHNPTVAPAHQWRPARTDQRVEVHAYAPGLLAALARERVVDRERHPRSRDPRTHEQEDGEAQLIETPSGRGKHAVIGAVVLGGHRSGGHDHGRDRATSREEPARHQSEERVEGRRGHRRAQRLDEGQERRDESHGKPRCCDGVG